MFCGVPSSDLSRNMDIAHRGVLMNLRCEAVFTAEIGQYSGIELLSRRSQIMRLCYLTPSLFKYLHKTPYYREMLDRNIESEISLMSLPGKWLRNQGNFRPTREMIENILYVWFSHLKSAGPCITNVFATRRKNFSQWHCSFQRKLRSHWLKFLRHVAKTLVRPCLIRPKPDLDFKIRILKPWGCKQTKCWIRIRFLENKCKIWIYFYPRPVLAIGYCRCLRLSVCVSVRVRQPSACPRDNSSSVQARITKFGP